MVQIAQKFEHFLEIYRRPDGSRWGGQDLHDATGGVVTRSYASNLRKGRIENSGFEKLREIAKAMGFPPELWFEDMEDLRKASGGRPSWFVDSEDNLALLDEELVEALRDETARTVLREVARLPERDTYLEDVLCPTLKRGQVVVMDNLSSHKGERVKQLIEGRECELVYLPPYSPDFNPIEQAFSKLNSYLREACPRTQQTLMELIGEAVHTITVSDAEGFFAHCGYRTVVQSL